MFIFIIQLKGFLSADNDSVFIIDYFIYKKSPAVVGFSCNEAKGERKDFDFIFMNLILQFNNYTVIL